MERAKNLKWKKFFSAFYGASLKLSSRGVFEAFLTAAADLLLRSLGEVFTESQKQNRQLAYLGYWLFGTLLGALSLALFRRRIVHPGKIPGASLVISPVLAGLSMWATGAYLRRHDKKVMQLENFGYGYVFAFGMALIRFLFAK